MDGLPWNSLASPGLSMPLGGREPFFCVREYYSAFLSFKNETKSEIKEKLSVVLDELILRCLL